jgi:hypothetical protein
MAYNKYKQFLDNGKKVEQKFAETLSSRGILKPASTKEDIYEHWDLCLIQKFDVKGMKRIKRTDDKPDENIHWVELRNVSGNDGWLFGDANVFVFETEDYWVLVEKQRLQDFIAEKCKGGGTSKTPELYKGYTRAGRKDLITLVKTIDLMAISKEILKK